MWLFCALWTVASPGSSVHGISQARILEWATIFFSRGSSQSRDWTCIFWTGKWVIYHWATRDAHIPKLRSPKTSSNHRECIININRYISSDLAVYWIPAPPCNQDSFMISSSVPLSYLHLWGQLSQASEDQGNYSKIWSSAKEITSYVLAISKNLCSVSGLYIFCQYSL